MRGHAIPRWLMVIGALVVLLLICEALGWPFLVKPLQNEVSKALQRDVAFSPPGGEPGKTRIYLLGRIRLEAEALHIAQPSWSQDPYFLDARGIDLALPYSAIWQAMHGEQIHIVRLHTDQLNVMAERQKDGNASWQFGAKPAPTEQPAKKTQIPHFDSLIVRQGDVVYRDQPLVLDLDAHVRTYEGGKVAPTQLGASDTAAPAAAAPAAMAPGATASGVAGPQKDDANMIGLVITTTGHYKKGTFDGRLNASGALPLLGGQTEPVPVILNFKSSQTSFGFKGQAANALSLDGITGEFTFKGPSLGDISDLLSVTLPTTPPFDLVGKVQEQTNLWNVLIDNAKIGSSQLQAQLQYDSRGAKPVLAGKLIGQTVLLGDLAPSIGGATPLSETRAPPPKKDPNARALPDRQFDLPSLQVMNADISVAVDNLELGKVFAQPLKPVKAHLTLKDGLLSISDLDATTAGGRLQGGITLNGQGPVALWNTDLRWTDVDMAQWLNQKRDDGKPPYLSGKLNGRAVLTGQGKSTGEILGSLNGTMGTSLRDGTMSHLIIEAAGLDIAQSLGVLVHGDDSIPITCAVADFRADKGVLFPRAVLIDTTDSTVAVQGTVSLATEKLDLKAVIDPKDKTPLAFRAPILVGGTFESPKVSLEASKLAPRAGAAALLALINPIAAVIPFIDLGDSHQVSGCETFLARRQKEGAGESLRGNTTPQPSGPIPAPGKVSAEKPAAEADWRAPNARTRL